jgi:hypothetical protein
MLGFRRSTAWDWLCCGRRAGRQNGTEPSDEIAQIAFIVRAGISIEPVADVINELGRQW